MSKQQSRARQLKTSKRLSYWLQSRLYLAFEWLIKQLPMDLVLALGRGVGHLIYHLAPGRRAIVLRNLRIALGRELELEEIEGLTRRCLLRTGENLIAALKVGTMSREEVMEVMKVEGKEHLDRALARGKGVIVANTHMGNWELGAQLGPLFFPGENFAAHYRPLANPYVDELVRRQRSRWGFNLFEKFASISAFANHLRAGGVLSVMCDQRIGTHGKLVPYFGRVTSITHLPLLLRARTGAEIVSVAMFTNNPGKWTLRFFPPMSDSPKPNAADLACLVERAVRTSPLDYFWLQDRWRIRRYAPFKVEGKGRMLQPAQQGPVEVQQGLAVVINEAQVPDNVSHLEIKNLDARSMDDAELFSKLDKIDRESHCGIDFIIGPSSLKARAAKRWLWVDS